MRGVIRVQAPEMLELSLTVTAELIEWRQIAKILDESEARNGTPADVLSRQIRALIDQAEKSLAQGSWTTGYASGVVEEK